MGVTPEGEPSGTVTARAGRFSQPPGKAVTVEIKSATVPPDDEVRWSWWATVDRHPYSDKLGYVDAASAKAAAEIWLEKNYPGRPITYV